MMQPTRSHEDRVEKDCKKNKKKKKHKEEEDAGQRELKGNHLAENCAHERV